MTQAQPDVVGFRYREVAEELKAQVISGEYKPGQRFPRQHDLAAEHNVAFATLKKALDILEKDGFVVRRIGRGTYAALPEPSKRNVLVIDNDKAILGFFKDVMGASIWNCVTADSGSMALEQMRQSRFDLIFLDLMMPGMNGAVAFQEIRKLDEDVPVVMITGFPDSGLMSEALESGTFSVMKKPFSPSDVQWTLNHSVRRYSAVDGS
jgi:CheY-like chemotaxis protein